MRTTINIDDELIAQAQACTGISQKTKLVEEALRRLLAQEAKNDKKNAAEYLIARGGTDPNAWAAPRRRAWQEQ